MDVSDFISAIPRVRALFAENFTKHDEIGASISIWHGQNEIFTHSGGTLKRNGEHSWTDDTLVPVWSATKGPAAACVHHALFHADLGVGTPVVEIWPQFAGGGKSAITVLEILSHRAGLAALGEQVPIDDYEAVISAIERQAPLWPLTAGHGYHARTYGFLLEELVRRLSGAASLGEFWRDRMARPLGFDIWIGLPESEDWRVATLYPGRIRPDVSPEEGVFYKAFEDPESLTRRAFTSPGGLNAVSDLNRPEVWRKGYPSMGGLASARGLAAFYAFLANGGETEEERYFSEESLIAMKTTQTQGHDKILLRPTAFAAGFMKDIETQKKKIFGPSRQAFGHPGAGGSNAFADSETGIGFAYVMNQMERSALPNKKSTRLVDAFYE